MTRRSSDYIDRETDFLTRLRINLHLLTCRHCRRFIGQLRATVGLLGASANRPDPDAVDEKLIEAFQTTNHRNEAGDTGQRSEASR